MDACPPFLLRSSSKIECNTIGLQILCPDSFHYPSLPFHPLSSSILFKFLFPPSLETPRDKDRLSAIGAPRGQGTVVQGELTVVGVHVRSVDLTGLACHIGQQLNRAFVCRS